MTLDWLVKPQLLGLPRSRIASALPQVDLSAAAHRRVATYSLGVKQRLGLAMALLFEPELLILDEPTNGLDPVGIREMRELLRSFSARGITVLVFSHLLAEVAQVATHVGVLAAGRLRYQGPLADLLARGRAGLRLESPRAADAFALLKARYAGATLDGATLFVPVAQAEAAAVVGALTAAGIPITHLDYQQEDLEAVFLRLIDTPTGSESTVEGRVA